MRLAIFYIAVITFFIHVNIIGQCPSNIWDTISDGSTYLNGLANKTIFGDFTNKSGAQYVNDGRLYFFGDIENDGYIGDGFGYEYIKRCDNTETSLRGGGLTEFNILNVDNPGGLFLMNEASIKTNLQFSSGIIRTDRTRTDHILTFIDGASYTGSNDDMHVDGAIKKIGSGPFSFPFGDGDHLAPMIIRGQNSFDIFEGTYISQNLDFIQQISKGNYPVDSTDFNIITVQDKEFWTLEGGQSTTITLSFTSYSEIGRLTNDVAEDLVVVGWDGERWSNLGQTDIVSFLGIGTITSRSVIPNIYDAFTFGVLDTDGDFYADSEDLDKFDPCIPEPSEACQSRFCVSVEASVYLEGALYNNGEYQREMRTQLSQFGYLPGQKPKTLLGVATNPGQPYNLSPWRYEGIEGQEIDEIRNIINNNVYDGDVVDWVLLSLRTTPALSSTVCTKAAWLMKDGSIQLTDFFDCCNQETDEFYLVIEHRNHLAVMSPIPLKVTEEGIISYDFRTNESYRSLLGSTQKMIFPDLYAMYASNGEQILSLESSRDINSNDNGFWAMDNGKHSGYYTQDFDLNGDVNVHDKAIWLGNNGVFTDVETPFN